MTAGPGLPQNAGSASRAKAGRTLFGIATAILMLFGWSALAAPPLPAHKPPQHNSLLDRPARDLFGAVKTPSAGPAKAIGTYADGCLAGAVALPITGPTWQVMRLSRNRNWGDPALVRYLKTLSVRAAKATGWPGILVGDMAQPRGGPAVSGHASHQIGLDADIWLEAMPLHTLSREERETIAANNVVATNKRDVDRTVWTPAHAAFIKAAANDPQVARIFVNAAIKKELCRTATGDRSWLHRIRPWYLHNEHIHVRLLCPPGETSCKGQPPIPPGEGCSPADFSYWFSDKVLHPKPPPVPPKPRPPKPLRALPAACQSVLTAR
jgi:penicillin-insensitive murein endopeptidase